VLSGTEVKSLRDGQAQLKDAYVTIRDGEAWLVGAYIAPYAAASRDNHLPEHDRKLLLHRGEIDRIIGLTREKGLTIVPTRIYFGGGDGGRSRAKVEIAVARGKDLYDKRQAIKARDTAREVAREMGPYR
jgi:SsrA-binding protein